MLSQNDHPIRLLLHGFTKPINNQMGAICSYPDNPDHQLELKGEERGMLYQLHKWEAAGRPLSCLWFPRRNLFSLGYNL